MHSMLGNGMAVRPLAVGQDGSRAPAPQHAQTGIGYRTGLVRSPPLITLRDDVRPGQPPDWRWLAAAAPG
jgi:hypothetical protein